MIIMYLLLQNNTKKARFFKKTILLTNISINIILKMFFFTFLDVNMQFIEK